MSGLASKEHCFSDFIIRLAEELDARSIPIVYTVGVAGITPELRYLEGRGISLKINELSDVHKLNGVFDRTSDIDFILTFSVEDAELASNITRSYGKLTPVLFIIDTFCFKDVDRLLSIGPIILIKRSDMLTQLFEYFKIVQSSRV